MNSLGKKFYAVQRAAFVAQLLNAKYHISLINEKRNAEAAVASWFHHLRLERGKSYGGNVGETNGEVAGVGQIRPSG